MRLSEAMRLGSMLKRQAYGLMFVPAEDIAAPGDVLGLRRVPSATCAIGAAFDAIGALQLLIVNGRVPNVMAAFPVLGRQTYCPLARFDCDYRQRVSVTAVILHLNDRHCLTREAIADWIETIEQQHEFGATVTSETAALR
jgi:hypothetical protein